jgi:hypothetical protein
MPPPSLDRRCARGSDLRAGENSRFMLGLLARSKLVRYEFMGSRLCFWALCITGIGVPFALLYLLDGTLRIESEMPNPEKFVSQLRAGI